MKHFILMVLLTIGLTCVCHAKSDWTFEVDDNEILDYRYFCTVNKAVAVSEDIHYSVTATASKVLTIWHDGEDVLWRNP